MKLEVLQQSNTGRTISHLSGIHKKILCNAKEWVKKLKFSSYVNMFFSYIRYKTSTQHNKQHLIYKLSNQYIISIRIIIIYKKYKFMHYSSSHSLKKRNTEISRIKYKNIASNIFLHIK